MIPQSFIQDLLNRVDIVDVVGRYVQLKKGGANFGGLCPFHNEKSPSFTVSPTKQFYHCFGCGAHGTAIGFLMEYSGVGFVDAVKDLAQGVGMTVPEEEDRLLPAQRAELQSKSMALSEAMTVACDYYRLQLRSASNAIDYLKTRGLSGEIAAKFWIGFAPDGWDNLKAVFPDYEAGALVEAGLVIDRSEEDGGNRKRYDRFRDRIMFPIRNSKGQVIGFGGRVMDKGEPKYLATLGTACTPVHVQKLLRQTDHVIFSFDGDKAGQRAARRALEACLPHASDNKTLKFLFLPAEHDPDSYIRQFGTEAFEKMVHDAMPLSQFLLNEVSSPQDLTTAEGRARAQYDAKPLLQAMPPSALRLQLLRQLAQVTQSTVQEMEALFELAKPVSRARAAVPAIKRRPPVELERQILRLLVAHPVLAADLDEAALSAICWSAPDGGVLLRQLVATIGATAGQASFASVAEMLRNQDADFDEIVAEIAAQSESDVDYARLELAGAVRQTTMKMLKAEQEQLAAEGLASESARLRYREINSQMDRLRALAEKEAAS